MYVPTGGNSGSCEGHVIKKGSTANHAFPDGGRVADITIFYQSMDPGIQGHEALRAEWCVQNSWFEFDPFGVVVPGNCIFKEKVEDNNEKAPWRRKLSVGPNRFI